ncbi:MAG: translation initiation factor IF-3 [Candidatus Levybacteria bacterium]|nr:translation initiation factor IF-3 [Candidatus Levybacteria bacterium]
MIKRSRAKQEKKVYYRTNDRIFGQQFRVLDADNKQIGVLSRMEALDLAREQGLDLVEVAATAKPPVVKIVDFNKFLYQQSKKKQEEKKKAKVSETKEIRLGPFMSDHDLEVVVRKGRDFLEDGDKIRLVLKFRGRQITHPEFGYQTMGKVTRALDDVSKVDRDPRIEGKQMVALISPERKKAQSETDQPSTENKNE